MDNSTIEKKPKYKKKEIKLPKSKTPKKKNKITNI